MNAAQTCNLAQLLRQTAALHADRPGLIQGEQQWTWGEIDRRVDALVAGLRGLGIGAGDRLLVQSRNTLAMFESCWVAFRLGAVWVPVNFRLTPPEVAYLGASSGAVAMLVDDGFDAHVAAVREAAPSVRTVVAMGRGQPGQPHWEELVAANLGATPEERTAAADDPLWFFYTSGTTGRPKAGMLTHGQMAFIVTNHLADLIPGTTEHDVSIAVAPLSHGAGIHALLNVARGAATVLL
ncbi:MAG: AMP-binding protein, partial [Betaproteobacteria bacterium]